MADCWRPAEHDRGRRTSYPNLSWRGDSSPTQRPPVPMRSVTTDAAPSATMESSRDPRKRQPSRSPEGRPSRKQSKPGVLDGKDAGGLVDGPTVDSALQRKANGTATNGLRAALVDSLTDVAIDDTNETKSLDFVLSLLTFIRAGVSKEASLQIPHDRAKARANRLHLEYKAMADKFGDFPAIKERKSDEKVAAAKELAAREKELDEHKAAQRPHLTTFAKMVGQRTDPSCTEFDRLSSTCDSLRAELQSARDAINSLTNQVKGIESRAEQATKTSGQIAKVQSTTSKLQNDVKTLQNDTRSLQDCRIELKAVREYVKEVDNRAQATNEKLLSLEKAGYVTRNQFEALMNTEKKKVATMEGMVALETKYERLDQDVAGVKKKHVELERNADQMKADLAASNLAPTQTNVPDDAFKIKVEQLAQPLIDKVSGLETKFQGLEENFQTMEEETNSLSENLHKIERLTRGSHDGNGNLKALSQRFEEVCKQLTQARESIDAMEKTMQDEGKGPIVKRLKSLDGAVNDISARIQAIQPDGHNPVQHRLSRLEQGQMAVQSDLKGVPALRQRVEKVEETQARSQGKAQDDVARSKTSSVPVDSPIDITPLHARMHECENELTRQRAEAEGKDELVGGEFEKIYYRLDRLDTSMKSVEIARASQDAQQRDLENVKSSLDSKASREDHKAHQELVQWRLEGLKKSVQDLKTEMGSFKTLQAQQQSPKTANQPPTWQHQHQHQHLPPALAPTPHSMSSVVMQSPQLPNGTRSPSIGTAPPQRLNTPQNPGTAQAPLAQAPDMVRMQVQLDQLVGVTQQLKQRCDNLQTDEVVRMMVDQMSHMYPHAKSFEASVLQLQADLNKLYNEQFSAIKELKQQVTEAKNVSAASKTSAEGAERIAGETEIVANLAKSTASKLSSDVQKLQADVDTVSTRLVDLVEDVKAAEKASAITKNAGHPGELISHEVKSALEKVSGLENEVQTVTKQTSSAKEIVLSKISECQGTMEFLQEKVKKLEKRLES